MVEYSQHERGNLNTEIDFYGDTLPENFDYENAYLELRRCILQDEFVEQKNDWSEMISEIENSTYYRVKDA